MTLSDFIINYLYIPLGGNRKKNKKRHLLNLWIIFLVNGF
ncbi:MAG: hypothetical protein ACTTJH_01710 [Bacteroidales bacterium]